MKNVIDLVNLVRFLEDSSVSKRDKVAEIKQARDNGEITGDEAFELALEYFTGAEPEQDEPFEDWDEPASRSVTGGDYGPGNPWDAPGMSARDFI